MFIEELIDKAYLEDKTIEYKGIIAEGKDKNGKTLEIGWLKTLVAFANTDGGKLIIGVENKTHKVVALDRNKADNIVLMLHRLIREKIDPIIDYEITSIPVNDTVPIRFVLCVQVNANKNLPVALHDNGLLGIYVRNYGRTDIASQEQIRDMVLMSDNTPFDTMLTDEIYHKKDFSKMFKLISDNGDSVEDKELISKNIISAEKKLSRGMLLFKDNCNDVRTKLVATQWPGITKGSSVVIASEVYTGNLLEVIKKTIEFIKNHSVNGYKKEIDTRIEYISFPGRAVTEGVVNAVGHRNYYIQGSQIEVNIFKDRLEITSPGALLGVRELHREKNISSIIPRRRNEIICEVLELCKYMEKKGSGFDKIEADYKGRGEEYRPYVSADAQSFTLTLPDLTFSSGVVSESRDNPEVYVETVLEGKNDLKILSFCFGKYRKVSEIASYVGVKPSTFFRKNVISRLASKGLLLEKKVDNVTMFSSNVNLVKLKDNNI
jgi:divergent AAA domain-containing protein